MFLFYELIVFILPFLALSLLLNCSCSFYILPLYLLLALSFRVVFYDTEVLNADLVIFNSLCAFWILPFGVCFVEEAVPTPTLCQCPSIFFSNSFKSPPPHSWVFNSLDYVYRLWISLCFVRLTHWKIPFIESSFLSQLVEKPSIIHCSFSPIAKKEK